MEFDGQDRKQLAKLWALKRKREDGGDDARDGSDKKRMVPKSNEQRMPKYEKKSSAGQNQKLDKPGDDRRSALTKSCTDRLAFSQFRAINEYLYSHSSQEAQSYMDESLFDKYHTAYDELAVKWPVKPIDEVINWMVKLYPKKGLGFVFCDMGCGSKPLLREPFSSATVHSFDLVSNHKHIVKADIAHVPLDKKSCHCVVFCLSLMGTNVKDYVLEASRILKRGGTLIIAEVTSRFEEEDVKTFVKKLDKGYGFRLKEEVNLPPNNFFVLLRFSRIKSAAKIAVNHELSLKPCIYKPR